MNVQLCQPKEVIMQVIRSHRSPWLAQLSIAAAATALSGACGSSDKTNSGAVTSVDSTKALDSLSTSEMQTLCNDFGLYLAQQTGPAFAERACLQSGLTSASLTDSSLGSLASQACHAAFSQCMGSSTSASAGIAVSGLCPTGALTAPSCTLTVSAYVTCLSDLVSAARAAWAMRNGLCDNLTSCTGLCNSPLAMPASCSLISTSCPGLTPVVQYTTST